MKNTTPTREMTRAPMPPTNGAVLIPAHLAKHCQIYLPTTDESGHPINWNYKASPRQENNSNKPTMPPINLARQSVSHSPPPTSPSINSDPTSPITKSMRLPWVPSHGYPQSPMDDTFNRNIPNINSKFNDIQQNRNVNALTSPRQVNLAQRMPYTLGTVRSSDILIKPQTAREVDRVNEFSEKSQNNGDKPNMRIASNMIIKNEINNERNVEHVVASPRSEIRKRSQETYMYKRKVSEQKSQYDERPRTSVYSTTPRNTSKEKTNIEGVKNNMNIIDNMNIDVSKEKSVSNTQRDEKHSEAATDEWKVFHSDGENDPHTCIILKDKMVECKKKVPVHIFRCSYADFTAKEITSEPTSVGAFHPSCSDCYISYSHTPPQTNVWVEGFCIHIDPLVTVSFTSKTPASKVVETGIGSNKSNQVGDEAPNE